MKFQVFGKFSVELKRRRTRNFRINDRYSLISIIPFIFLIRANHSGAIMSLGTAASDCVLPRIANLAGLPFSTYFGFFLSTMIVIASLCISRVELSTERTLRSNEENSKPDTLQEPLLKYQTPLGNHDHHYENISLSATSTSNQHLSSTGSEVNNPQGQHTKNPLPQIGDVIHLNKFFWLVNAAIMFVYPCQYSFNIAASGILMERNYFLDPSADCQLILPNQCTSGTLEPSTGNPSFDCSTGESCPVSNYAAVLPSSLNVTKGNTRWSKEWESDEYVFDILNPSDVNCVDSFWADACTKNYCDGKDDATEKAGMNMTIPFLVCLMISPFIGE